MELHRDEVRERFRGREVLVAVCSLQSALVELYREASVGPLLERNHVNFFIELPHVVHRRDI